MQKNIDDNFDMQHIPITTTNTVNGVIRYIYFIIIKTL